MHTGGPRGSYSAMGWPARLPVQGLSGQGLCGQGLCARQLVCPVDNACAGLQAKAAKAAQEAGSDAAAAGVEPNVIDLEEPETAAAEAAEAAAKAAPTAKKPAGARGGPAGKAGGRQRVPKRKGDAAAANGLANGSSAAAADVNGTAPMDVSNDRSRDGSAAVAEDSITSANAYLLVYRRRMGAPSQPAPQLPAR